MLVPKVWIPILIVLLAVVFSGLLYSQKTNNQPATTRFIPVETPQTPKPPPPGETHETGHWHGDHWHSTAPVHEDFLSPLPFAGDSQTEWFSDADGNWYPPDYTQADIQADLAGEGAMTDEEYHRRAVKYTVNAYIQKHLKAHPDCTEYQAIINDGKRFAAWRLADQDFVVKDNQLTDEMTLLGEEMEQLFEKYDYQPILEATHIPEAERRKDFQRLESLMADVRSNAKRRDALSLEKSGPIPKPMHTH